METNLDRIDVVNARLAQSAAILDLLIANYEGTSEEGDFGLRASCIHDAHDAHDALDVLVEQARAAALQIKFTGKPA